MQSYTRATVTVEAFQSPWPMTIVVNGKTITGLAGEWLVVPANGKEPFFMSDLDFEAQFSVVVVP